MKNIKDIIKDSKYISPSYLVLTGSHGYGYNVPESDEDYRGFTVPDIDSILGINEFKIYEQSAPNPDLNIYSLQHYLRLLAASNMQCMEILWADPKNIIVCDETGRKVIDNRNLFLSKKGIYRSIKGYAFAEWRKAKAVEQSLEFKEEPQREALDLLTSRFHVERQDRDKIIDILQEYTKYDPRVEKDVSKNLGSRRKESFDKFGFCTKNAAHTIRLISQGIELLTYGELTFPRPEADILKNIRTGHFSLKEVEEAYAGLSEDFDLAFANSNLPEKVDISKINRLYREIAMDSLVKLKE